MLPTEAFAEAIGFLRLYDLNALAVTNAICSSLAVKASSRIRREEFPDICIYAANGYVHVFRCFDAPKFDDGTSRLQFVALLRFPSEDDMIQFVVTALPNCVSENMGIAPSASSRLLDAIGSVADCVVVKGGLLVDSMSTNDSLDLVRKFRKLKALQLFRESDGNDDEIASFYRGSGVQELQFFSSYNDYHMDSITKKIALI